MLTKDQVEVDQEVVHRPTNVEELRCGRERSTSTQCSATQVQRRPTKLWPIQRQQSHPGLITELGLQKQGVAGLHWTSRAQLYASASATPVAIAQPLRLRISGTKGTI